jgi:hypothetical protein
MSGNYFINSNSNNYINSSSYGRTGPNSYSYTGSAGSVGSVGSASAATTGSTSATGSSINDEINYPVPNGAFVFQVINPERNVCNITHDEILADQQYMTCCNCHIHFLESALKRWLRVRSPAIRTCPTCREVWSNYTVYINRVNSG